MTQDISLIRTADGDAIFVHWVDAVARRARRVSLDSAGRSWISDECPSPGTGEKNEGSKTRHQGRFHVRPTAGRIARRGSSSEDLGGSWNYPSRHTLDVEARRVRFALCSKGMGNVQGQQVTASGVEDKQGQL